jgi:hypothetical protein
MQPVPDRRRCTNISSQLCSCVSCLHGALNLTHIANTRSFNDCHSNRTAWQWYSGVAPASWLVVSEVNRSRKELNFSNWAACSAADQRKHLFDICKEIMEIEM